MDQDHQSCEGLPVAGLILGIIRRGHGRDREVVECREPLAGDAMSAAHMGGADVVSHTLYPGPSNSRGWIGAQDVMNWPEPAAL
jgi:hypothetical protein